MITPEELKEWMEQHGVTQGQLADAIYTTRVTINRFITGKGSSAGLVKRIEEYIQKRGVIRMRVNKETQDKLSRLAARAGVSPEVMAERLLAELLGIAHDAGDAPAEDDSGGDADH